MQSCEIKIYHTIDRKNPATLAAAWWFHSTLPSINITRKYHTLTYYIVLISLACEPTIFSVAKPCVILVYWTLCSVKRRASTTIGQLLLCPYSTAHDIWYFCHPCTPKMISISTCYNYFIIHHIKYIWTLSTSCTNSVNVPQAYAKYTNILGSVYAQKLLQVQVLLFVQYSRTVPSDQIYVTQALRPKTYSVLSLFWAGPELFLPARSACFAAHPPRSPVLLLILQLCTIASKLVSFSCTKLRHSTLCDSSFPSWIL